MSLDNAAGLLGTAVGFVVLGEGIKLVSDATKDLYKRNGHKIHPMSKYHKMKKFQETKKKMRSKKKGSPGIYSNYESFIPDVRFPKI